MAKQASHTSIPAANPVPRQEAAQAPLQEETKPVTVADHLSIAQSVMASLIGNPRDSTALKHAEMILRTQVIPLAAQGLSEVGYKG